MTGKILARIRTLTFDRPTSRMPKIARPIEPSSQSSVAKFGRKIGQDVGVGVGRNRIDENLLLHRNVGSFDIDVAFEDVFDDDLSTNKTT